MEAFFVTLIDEMDLYDSKMTDEKKETQDTTMDRNNQTEIYSLVAVYCHYCAAYPGYQPQDAKKQAEAILPKLTELQKVVKMKCHKYSLLQIIQIHSIIIR